MKTRPEVISDLDWNFDIVPDNEGRLLLLGICARVGAARPVQCHPSKRTEENRAAWRSTMLDVSFGCH
jgi:hypothetical protein